MGVDRLLGLGQNKANRHNGCTFTLLEGIDSGLWVVHCAESDQSFRLDGLESVQGQQGLGPQAPPWDQQTACLLDPRKLFMVNRYTTMLVVRYYSRLDV
jgi:hypothetical protein